MKINLLKTTALCITVLLLGFSACKKDKNPEPTPPETTQTVKSFFDVTGATYSENALPLSSSSGPVIENVTGNGSIIDGGSNILQVHSSSNVKNILIAKKGATGHYTLSANQAGKSTYQVTLIFASQLPEDEFTITVALVDDNNLISNYSEIFVRKIENVGAGILQFSMSFDLLNDIDLHVVQPDNKEIYYGNPGGYDYSSIMIAASEQLTPEQYEHISTLSNHNEIYAYLSQYMDLESYKENGGWLDIDSNVACNLDSINNENINYNYASDIKTGEYIVRVDFWSDCMGGDLNTNYVVTAKYNGQIINGAALTQGSNPYHGHFEPGTSDCGGEGSGVEIMRVNISSAALQAAANNNKPSYELFYGKKPAIQKTINIAKPKFHLNRWLKKMK